MSDVFISYARDNHEMADRLAEDLRRSGHRVFYDKELLPGEEWDSRLTAELRRARYVLILLSPAYVHSRSARLELEAAALLEAEGRPRIVPVVVEYTEIPPFLRSRQFADLSKDYEGGFARIQKALATKPESTPGSRARLWRGASDLLVSLLGLLAGAVSAIVSWRGSATVQVVDLPTIAVGVGVALGLTALVAAIWAYQPRKRPRPLETAMRGVERAYVDALDASSLNPLRIEEASRG